MIDHLRNFSGYQTGQSVDNKYKCQNDYYCCSILVYMKSFTGATYM